MNAKELQLSKLNAGVKTIGMYLYGIMIGMPFDTVADIMMSTTGRLITDLMESNVFTRSRGCKTLDDVFNYLEVGPKELIRNFSNSLFIFEKEKTFRLMSPADKLGDFLSLKYSDRKESVQMKLAHLAWDRNLTLEEKLNYIDSLFYGSLNLDYTSSNLLENAHKLEQLIMKFEQLKRAAKEYILQVYQVAVVLDGKIILQSDTYSDIKKLAGGAEECKVLGQILGLNKGLKSKTDEQIKKIRDIEGAISARFRLVNNENYRKDIQDYYSYTLINIGSNVYRKLDDSTISTDPIKLPYKMESPDLSFKIEELLTNPKKVIDMYEHIKVKKLLIPIKHSFNIFDCVLNVDHFLGYLQTLIVAHVSDKQTSPKYKFIYDLGSSLCEKFLIYGKDLERAFKNLELYYSDTIRRTWMRQKGLSLCLAKGLKVFVKGNIKPVQGRTEIILGTPDADATYKRWVEYELIPELKRKYPYNKFILNLKPQVITRTISHNSVINYGLPINMMPHTDLEQTIFDLYKAEFNKLRSYKLRTDSLAINGILSPDGNYISVSEALYLYGLIAHYGKSGQQSLMPIFLDVQKDGLAKDFHQFESEFDDSIYINNARLFEIRPYIVPTKSLWEATSEYVYALNKDTMRIELYRKTLENSREYNSDEYDTGAVQKDLVINGYELVRLGKFLEDEATNHYMYGDRSLAKLASDYLRSFSFNEEVTTFDENNMPVITGTNRDHEVSLYYSANGMDITIENNILLDTLYSSSQSQITKVVLSGNLIVVYGMVGGNETIIFLKTKEIDFSDPVLESWNGNILPSREYYQLLANEIINELRNGCI